MNKELLKKSALIAAGFLSLPLFIAALVQIPLCYIKPLSEYIGGLNEYVALIALSLLFALPVYALVLWAYRGWKKKLVAMLVSTILLGLYLPFVWVFAYNLSNRFFNSCGG